MSKRKTQSQSTSIPHPLAQAIRDEAAKEAPAEPQSQPIPAPVWSVLRGLRNRGYSVQQISVFLSRHGYSVDPTALAKRLRPRNPRSDQPQDDDASTSTPPAAQADANGESSDESATEANARELGMPPAGRNEA
jgi:hypothetical protein